MRRETRPAVLPVVFAAIFALAPARAAFCQMPFAVFGARQAALGGAAVALGDDPAGFMNNPALLNPAGTSYAGSLGVLATSGADFYPLVKGVAGNDPAELATPGSPNAGAVRANPRIELLATEHGGHLGFIGRRPHRFWSDDAIMEWIVGQNATKSPSDSSRL